MSTLELTMANFNDVTTRDGVVLVDFWAEWCGPCKMFAPVYESVSKRHPQVVFGKVDTESEPELAAAFDIRSIPTLMAVRDGVVVFAQPGALPERAVEELIAKVEALDMEEVHRHVAEAGHDHSDEHDHPHDEDAAHPHGAEATAEGDPARTA